MTGKPESEVKGVNNLNAEYQEKYGPGEYAPVVWIAYWSWRVMLGCGFLLALFGLVGWWLNRKGKLDDSRRFLKFSMFAAALPFIASCGRLDLHRDGPPALGRLRPAENRGRRTRRRSDPLKSGSPWSASPCSTACWRSSPESSSSRRRPRVRPRSKKATQTSPTWECPTKGTGRTQWKTQQHSSSSGSC